MLLNFVVFVVLYNCMLAKCMYVFYISLARKNGHGQLPEHNLSINQSINIRCAICYSTLQRIYMVPPSISPHIGENKRLC